MTTSSNYSRLVSVIRCLIYLENLLLEHFFFFVEDIPLCYRIDSQ